MQGVALRWHADSDHFNGVPDLLDRFAIGAVRIPPGFADPRNPGAARLVAAIEARGIPVVPIAAGATVDLGAGLTLTARHPNFDSPGTDNARSVVLEVAHGGRRLLLTGDLEKDGLARILDQVPPDRPVDALLAPHHGGRTSNPRLLYEWARPQIVAVSQRPPVAGNKDPLAFLATMQPAPRLLPTWQAGAIRFRWLDAGLAATGYLDPVVPAVDPRPVVRAAFLALPSSWPAALVATLAGLVAGASLAVGVIAVEWGAWSLVAPGRRLVAAPAQVSGLPPGRRITARGADGSILVGDAFAAGRGAGTGRTIVLLHGLAEDRRAFEVRVPRLLAAGWDVAAVDARGSGESGGRRVSFGGREADDLRAWLDALTALAAADSADSPRFAAWGRSMGAATALRAAAADRRIEALILEAPYADLRWTVAAVLRRVRVPGGLAGLVLRRARWLAGVALDRPRPVDLAPGVAAAVLVVHGADDPIAPPGQVRQLAGLIGRDHGRAAERIEVPGAAHANVFGVGGEALADAVVAFLDRAVPA